MSVTESHWDDEDGANTPLSAYDAQEDRIKRLFAPGLPVYAIVDGAVLPNFAEWINGVAPEARALFDIRARPELEKTTPWLIPLNPQDTITRALTTSDDESSISAMWHSEAAVFMLSDRPADTLFRQMRRCIQIKTEQDRTLYLRFWQASLLPTLLIALERENLLSQGPFLGGSTFIVPQPAAPTWVGQIAADLPLSNSPLILTDHLRARLAQGVRTLQHDRQVAAALPHWPATDDTPDATRHTVIATARTHLLQSGWPVRAVPPVLSIIAQQACTLDHLPLEARKLIANDALSHRARGKLLQRHMGLFLQTPDAPRSRADDEEIDIWQELNQAG